MENRISERCWKRTNRERKGLAEERELDSLWSDEEAEMIAAYLPARYQEE